MKLNYVPLLHVQRDLHDLPRGPERFREYLRTILNDDGSDVELPPLVLMNPMGKDHVTALLDALLALDADGVGARAAADASAALADVPGDYKVALVVADDLMGGWTNRYAYEFALRFGSGRARVDPNRRRSSARWSALWITGVLWSSEAPTERAVREAVLTGRPSGGLRAAARPGPHAPRHARPGGTRHGGGGLHRARPR